MKILYIVNARIPTEKAHGLTIVKSCEGFALAGHDVSLVVPRRTTHIKGDAYSVYGVAPVFTIRFLPVIDTLRWSGGRFAFYIEAATFYISVLVFALSRSRKEVIYTRDSVLCLLSLIGFHVFYECHALPRRRRLFLWLARRASGVITISHALERVFFDVGFLREKILVAPSGVDLSIFEKRVPQDEARRSLELPLGAPLAVYTGNFTTFGEDKGIADIIAALPLAPEVRFLAIGGSDADIAHYQAQADERGVQDRVILRPRGPQTQLALAQQAADMLLMPFPDTPHYRNHMSPVKMFEYMASGKPIIASDLPTIREVLNEDNAVIVPSGDSEVIARAMTSICKDSEKVRRIALHAQEDARRYSWQERTRLVLAFISKYSKPV